MQIDWKPTGWGIKSWPDQRFVITRTTDGFNLIDTRSGDITRCHTVQGAKYVAGLRCGEAIVHRWENKLYA
jgi:hypothetical protein